MVIAGPCLLNNYNECDDAVLLASQLPGYADLYRIKLWGGGTRPEKYFPGIGEKGIETIKKIRKHIPVGVEIQTPDQFRLLKGNIDYVWIGARNAQNYGLIKYLLGQEIKLYVKRGPWMTIQEVIGLYDICKGQARIIERGISTIDRTDGSRWGLDIKGIIKIKFERPEIFDSMVVDCSHSVEKKQYISDTYIACRAIGINHFMFECTLDGKSQTDSSHMLSLNELKNIL